MAIARFYCPLPLAPGRQVVLPEAVARHAQNALRLRSGDAVVLFNGNGEECAGSLAATGRQARVAVRDCQAVARESPLRVTLAQGISSGERMDYTLQKAVELGVSAIAPVMTRRTVVRLDEGKRPRRRAHWQGVVMSACEQSGRVALPEVAEIRDFPDWLAEARAADATRFILDPAGGRRLRDLPAPAGPVLLLAGPEGGFDPAERDAALAAGFLPLNLGPRVLRTETAAVAALAAMQCLWGDA
ncbi:MAG: 16S rRNA (uracil(1498)-N(3))-methyltransferase [Thiobacillaceae bacterium]|jgi:16S rRNA (uracil1498-N3)-methyltransferase|nr:16S rRNA (uracil(1498)-N(3))-methyltransferase [Thiobacillaceae bacterium]